MKIRILSDLHIDINNNKNNTKFDKPIFGFENEDLINSTDLILICGDISGSYFKLNKYLDKLNNKLNNTKIIFILGNHEFYEYDIERVTKNQAIKELKEKYTKNDKITFLDNNYIEIDNKIIVGCPLYTDFTLYGSQSYSKNIASLYINDFRYVHLDDNGINRRVMPEDYIKWHKESVEYINKICKQFINKDVIVMTHFLPTEQGISSEYIGDECNPFYCTNLEDLMLYNQNIKLWCFGHSHSVFEGVIGSTTIINSCYGYSADKTFGHNGNKLRPLDYSGKTVDI